MPPMPTLGPQPRSRPLAKVLMISLVLGGIVGGIFWLRTDKVAETAVVEAPPASEPAEPKVAELPKPVEEVVPEATGPRSFSVEVHGPLETAVIKGSDSEIGPALAQVINRALVWWMTVPRDLRAGDLLEVVYEPVAGEEPRVHAVRYTSDRHGKTFAAYRFHAEGDTYARFYEADGRELEERLRHSPLDDYEQVTSILRDGRGHKGVDFKLPTGGPVKAPFDGVVTRRNWNFRANGNCIELKERGGKGRTAIFLHLDALPAGTQTGKSFQRGEVIAQSGNSGRSFAPHLHYQLMSGNRVLDPFREHQVYKREVPATAKAAFDAERARLDALLTPVAASTTP
ncbi:MAG TPA: M23 family metallopeptidase [Myxococcaceae bacterium]|nr:M23 family metallopeptidase [Myxococcaceae bacterium]